MDMPVDAVGLAAKDDTVLKLECQPSLASQRLRVTAELGRERAQQLKALLATGALLLTVGEQVGRTMLRPDAPQTLMKALFERVPVVRTQAEEQVQRGMDRIAERERLVWRLRGAHLGDAPEVDAARADAVVKDITSREPGRQRRGLLGVAVRRQLYGAQGAPPVLK
jgi:hypothetical protein